MTTAYMFAQLADSLPEIPADSILSRTLYSDDTVKAVLFAFAPGQELSEHTAALPATLVFVQGEARVVLNGDQLDARAGTWIHMPPHLPHSITAHTPVIMLLLLFRAAVE